MRRHNKALPGLAILFALAVCTAPVRTAAELDESACVLEAPGVSKRFARCAVLEVPLDPEAPEGEQFELFVARIPAQNAKPQPDPLVLIAGGPGQSTVDFYMLMRGAFGPVRRERDIILVDQRGTGRSATGFQCELPEDVDFLLSDEGELDAQVAECLAGLERDPRFFTTSVAVRDLDAVRRELGVDRWNIYGVSYGTRVAQHYLRRYPERVRTLVLDGVVPPGVVLGPDIARNAQAALERIFNRCTLDYGCWERFGELGPVFDDLMARIKDSPVSVARTNKATGEMEETLVTEEYLMGVTRMFSYSDAWAALLPLIIDEAANGRFEMLLAQAELIRENLDRALSFPMHNSVICSEDHPFDEVETSPAGNAYLGTSIVDALNVICTRWPRGLVDPDFREPLVSARPVLLLSGSNDPVTPAKYADDVIDAGLSRAIHLVGYDQGHGMAPVGCMRDLMQEFIDTEETEYLDVSCLSRLIPAPFFLSDAGPGP